VPAALAARSSAQPQEPSQAPIPAPPGSPVPTHKHFIKTKSTIMTKSRINGTLSCSRIMYMKNSKSMAGSCLVALLGQYNNKGPRYEETTESSVRTIVVGTEICAGPPVIPNQWKIEKDIEGFCFLDPAFS